jgi:hypothetical protein
MYHIGQKVKLQYRAFGPIEEGEGEIIKITPSGFLRIKGKTGDTERNELFDPDTGFARGWNTLRFI